MATSAAPEIGDILLCSICLEKLRNPKYLPCLHTYCEECISTYITSVFEQGNKQTIKCPLCRNIIPAPKDNCSPKEWAKLLPVNFLIIGLLDKEKAQRPEKQCMSCERLDMSSVANFICLECADMLCEGCCRYHRANKYTLGHEIKLLSDVSRDEIFPKSFKNKCSEHQTKNLKLFCVDHDTPCCSMCVTITHRKCGDIISIEDAAKQFVADKNDETVQKDLQKVKEHMRTIVKRHKSRLSGLESQYKSKFKTIENKYQSMLKEVQAIETLRKSELLKLYEERKNEIETTKAAFENRLKAIEYEEEILRVSINKAPNAQVMIESKKVMQKSEEHMKFIAEGKANAKCYELCLSNLAQFESISQQMKRLCKVTCKDMTNQEHTSQALQKNFDDILDERTEAMDGVDDEGYFNTTNRFSVLDEDDPLETDFLHLEMREGVTSNSSFRKQVAMNGKGRKNKTKKKF